LPSLVPAKRITRGVISTLNVLVKLTIVPPTIHKRPSYTKIYMEATTGQITAVMDSGEARGVLWCEDPRVLDIEGAVPGTTVQELEQQRRELLRNAQPLTGAQPLIPTSRHRSRRPSRPARAKSRHMAAA
jgi:hypothetical protein